MGGELRMRMALLHIDRGADLPLAYTYEAGPREFRAVGFVRLRGHDRGGQPPGPDTGNERDAFLRRVLTSLGLSPRQVERIVRTAEHPGEERPSTRGTPDCARATRWSAGAAR